MRGKKKILFIVEGEETEASFIGSIGHRLLTLNQDEYEIFPYKTSIYELYAAYINGEYDYIIDYLVSEKLIQIPYSITPKEAYSAIYLIFDFNYQKYDDEKIRGLLKVFNNETVNGKLYINYPMFESYFHINSIPDNDYINRTVESKDCYSKIYKKKVNLSTCIRKSRKIDKKRCFYIIKSNYEKAMIICGLRPSPSTEIDYELILEKQIEKKNSEYCIYVLNTFVLFIIDINPALLRVIENLDF